MYIIGEGEVEGELGDVGGSRMDEVGIAGGYWT